jgi:hut operon positive regulator
MQICRKGKGDHIEMRLKDFLGSEKKNEPELLQEPVEVASFRAEASHSSEKTMKGKMRLQVSITLSDESQIGRSALLLASTTGPEEEKNLKDQIVDFGWKAVATEVGGLAGELPQKITRAVVGAALNGEIVRKTSSEMHGLMHAAFEAMNGFMSIGMLEASIGVKIGIVRNRTWIAVAVVGDTAYHAVAHHERCGLGVMHI